MDTPSIGARIGAAMRAERPNILVIMTDQHRADMIGCAGDPVVQTPHLDRLAAEGVRFERAYCQGPLCMPARASFLTERYVRDHGVSENLWDIPSTLPTFPQQLQGAGYHTACIGKMHFFQPLRADDLRNDVERTRAYGFDEAIEVAGKVASSLIASHYDEYLQEEGLYDRFRDWADSRYRGVITGSTERWRAESTPLPVAAFVDTFTGRRTARWIEEYDRQEPFLLWAGFPGPHPPWDAPKEYVDRYRDAEITLGSLTPPELPESGPLRRFLDRYMATNFTPLDVPDEEIREVRRHYYGAITLIDEQIGAILAALERRNILDSTWIVYTTDHGEMMGDHRLFSKTVFYEPSVRVPLIVRPPGGREPGVGARGSGRIVTDLVEHVDLPATLREIAGAGELAESAGRSLLAALSPADLSPDPSPTRRGEPRLTSGVRSTTGYSNRESSVGALAVGSPLPVGEGSGERSAGKRSAGDGRTVAVSENHGFGCFITERYKLVVWEDSQEPVALFDLQDDPREDRNVVADPRYAKIRDQLLRQHVAPFLSRPPVRYPRPAGARGRGE